MLQKYIVPITYVNIYFSQLGDNHRDGKMKSSRKGGAWLFPDPTSAPSPDRAPAPHVPPVSARVPWRPRLS